MKPESSSHAYRTVLLDVDGTLVDSNDLHAQAWKEALFDRGYYVPIQKIRKLIGMGGDKLVPALTGLPSDSPEAKALKSYRSGVFLNRYLPKVKPFPHVRTLLERMREEELTLVVVTSAGKDEAAALLEAAGVRDLVDGVVNASNGAASKPDPDLVFDALASVNASPEDAVLIGDTSYDIEAGARAKVKVLALRCGGSPEATLADAAWIYDDPMDLLENFATSPLGAGRGGYKN